MLTNLPDFIAEARTFVEEHGIRLKDKGEHPTAAIRFEPNEDY